MEFDFNKMLDSGSVKRLSKAFPVEEMCPKCGWKKVTRFHYQLIDGTLCNDNGDRLPHFCRYCGQKMSNITINKMLMAMKNKE